MMHDEYTTLMSLVLDREAVPAEVQRLQEHLRSCRSCAETWQQWQILDHRLAASPMVAVPVGLAERAVARLDHAELRRRRMRWLGRGLLAGLVGLVGAAALWGGLAFTWFHASTAMLAEWVFIVAQWISALLLLGRGAWAAVSSLGAPTLAGAVGLLACATCILGMTWLWLVPRRARAYELIGG